VGHSKTRQGSLRLFDGICVKEFSLCFIVPEVPFTGSGQFSIQHDYHYHNRSYTHCLCHYYCHYHYHPYFSLLSFFKFFAQVTFVNYFLVIHTFVGRYTVN